MIVSLLLALYNYEDFPLNQGELNELLDLVRENVERDQLRNNDSSFN